MQVVYPSCCGLDIHTKFVVACFMTTGADGNVQHEIRTFTTMTQELVALVDWLQAVGCTPIAMESTSFFWRPVSNLLEGLFEVLVVNASPLKAVPGRKTDVKDVEWIAELLRHGLFRASFIPPQTQRHLRDLTRSRTPLIEERARQVESPASRAGGCPYQAGLGGHRCLRGLRTRHPGSACGGRN